MKKRYALITDIHGNIEALDAVLNDIEKQNVDCIYCLGDTIDIGPNSKECIDRLIDNNIKMILGNHELYMLNGIEIKPRSVSKNEKEHIKWVKSSLTVKELDFIKNCPKYYEIEIDNKKIMLCHYLMKDKNADQPFEPDFLKKNLDLWIKYNDPNIIYVIGHLHNYFDVNEVEGISNNRLESTGELTNIELVSSLGCSKDEYARYAIMEIDDSIKFERIKVKYDRDKFVNKITNIDFPDKEGILKYFYGIE